MRAVLALALALSFTATAMAQQAPALEKGFSPDKLYAFGDIDAINTFNGNLPCRFRSGLRTPWMRGCRTACR